MVGQGPPYNFSQQKRDTLKDPSLIPLTAGQFLHIGLDIDFAERFGIQF